MRTRTSVVSLALLLLCSMQSSTQKLPSNVASAQIFVRKFYKWYTAAAKKPHEAPAAVIALGDRGSSFDSKLAEDTYAAINANALPFDPFFGVEGCDAYPESTPTLTKTSILVPVFCSRGGKLSDKPVVTVEVTFEREKWYFNNFVYEKGDLRSMLAAAKK